jgi:hypothetical protein
MTANRNLILAGISGGGAAGTALAMFANVGATMPVDALTDPVQPVAPAAPTPPWFDPGWITEDGLTRAVNVNTNEVNAYGSSVPVRIIKTSRTTTFSIKFLESNPVSLAIYHELPLGPPAQPTDPGITVDDSDGSFDIQEGSARSQLYAAYFDIVDGKNHVRALVPQLEVTGQEDFAAAPGAPLTYGVTFTAYPGTDGVAIHWFYVLDALVVP